MLLQCMKVAALPSFPFQHWVCFSLGEKLSKLWGGSLGNRATDRVRLFIYGYFV